MRRHALALIVLVAASLPVFGGNGAVADRLDDQAVSNIAACFKQRGQLLIEFLIDQSGSLQETDPDGQRVGAIKIAIAGLQRLAARDAAASGRSTIEVQLAGFDVEYQALTDWTSVNSTTGAALQQQADAYAEREHGFETDYAAAFLGTQTSLAQRLAQLSRSGSEQACSAIMWFTDGKYEIDVRGSDSERSLYGESKPYAPQFDLTQSGDVERAATFGRELLCNKGGVIDQLRNSGTSILAFLLSTQVTSGDADFLRAIATGRGGPLSCGQARARPTGAAYEAGDVGKVLIDFDGVTAKANGGSQVGGNGTTPLCPRTACAAGTRRFTIDPGLRSFHLLAVTGSKQIVIQLTPPGARAPVIIEPPSAKTDKVAQTTLVSQWPAGNALVVDAKRGSTDDMWVGEWQVTFIDPLGTNPGAAARSQIHIYGDLEPGLKVAPRFVLGQTTTVQVIARHEDGTPATDLGTFRAAIVTAQVIEPGRNGIRNALTLARRGDEFAGSYKVDRSIRASQLNVTLQLSLVTKSGIALAPIVRTFPVDVRPPETYPTLSPSRPRFHSITGSQSSSATLEVRGGSGAGCLWFEPIQTESLPDGVSNAVLTVNPPASSERSCLHVNAGQRRTVTLTIKPTGIGNGSLIAQVTARLKAEGNDRKIPHNSQSSSQWRNPLTVHVA